MESQKEALAVLIYIIMVLPYFLGALFAWHRARFKKKWKPTLFLWTGAALFANGILFCFLGVLFDFVELKVELAIQSELADKVAWTGWALALVCSYGAGVFLSAAKQALQMPQKKEIPIPIEEVRATPLVNQKEGEGIGPIPLGIYDQQLKKKIPVFFYGALILGGGSALWILVR